MEWTKLLNAGRKTGEKTAKFESVRSPFEADFDRIIFSHPFRRLQDKTQVHPLPEDDFVHTRLSHSLEVSSVGRSLGKSVGQVILERHPELKEHYSLHDFGGIVAAAALAHDIGNPPFGHSGEKAISDYFRDKGTELGLKSQMTEKQWADLTNFEGNAQGFRILTSNRYLGLRLTGATLAAFSKYPRESVIDKRDPKRRSQKKYGYFQSEKDVFAEVASRLELLSLGENSWARHPLTFLVEAADDICYAIIDLEDGCRLGLVSYKDTEELLIPIVGEKFNRRKLEESGSVEEKIGVLRALAITNLIQQCCDLFLTSENSLLEASLDTSLTELVPASNALSEIIRISLDSIYRSRKVLEIEAVGYEVIPGILETITEACYFSYLNPGKQTGKHQNIIRLLPAEMKESLDEKNLSAYDMSMLCTDFVSGMTDRGAIGFYRLIKGIDLPRG